MAEFQERARTARAMGAADKLRKQREGGRLDARQRIEQLVDPGSFHELGTLVGALSRDGLPPAPADALVGGLATIDGRPIVVASEDFTVQGGSIGLGNHAKRVRLANIALNERIPMILMLEGAGERTSNALQRHPHAPNDLQILAKLKGKVPTLALIMGASAGHGALSGLLTDFIVMVDDAALFVAGPPLVEAALGEKISKQDLGGPTLHTQVSGVAHNHAATEDEAFELARHYLSFFTSDRSKTTEQDHDTKDCRERELDRILDLVPANGDMPYDMKAVIAETFDNAEFLEIQPGYGRSMVTGLARLGGTTCAIVANQPDISAGAIDASAAQKAARFLRVAGDFHLPVVFFADNPGVLPGNKSEAEGALIAAADMYLAQSRLQSPKLHVTLRKAFGFGSSLMAMNPFDAQTLTLAFPGATLGGVPAKGGAEAASLDDADAASVHDAEADACWTSADTMAYDEIIDPRQLRNYLLAGLQASRARSKD